MRLNGKQAKRLRGLVNELHSNRTHFLIRWSEVNLVVKFLNHLRNHGFLVSLQPVVLGFSIKVSPKSQFQYDIKWCQIKNKPHRQKNSDGVWHWRKIHPSKWNGSQPVNEDIVKEWCSDFRREVCDFKKAYLAE